MVKKTIDEQTPGDVKVSHRMVIADDSNNTIKDTVGHALDYTLHTGLRSGLVMTVNANPALFDVSAGEGVILDKLDPVNPVLTRIIFPQTLGIVDPNLTEAFSHVYIDSAGTLTVEVNPPTRTDIEDRIFLGSLRHSGGEIARSEDNPVVSHGSSITEITDLVLSGGMTISGGILSAASTDLSLNDTAAIVKQYGRNSLIDLNSPNIIDAPAQMPIPSNKFFKVFIDGSGDFIVDQGGQTDQLDPTLFNDGGLGTLISVSPSNLYTVVRAFVSSTGSVIFYYGTQTYSSSEEALAAVESTFMEHPDVTFLSPIAKIAIKANVTDLTAAIASGDPVISPVRMRT